MIQKRNGIISYLKLLATYMVFVCHATLYSCDKLKLVLKPNWQIMFKTPAWGGGYGYL